MPKTHIPSNTAPAKGISPQELGSQSDEEAVRTAENTQLSQILAEKNAKNPDGATHAAAPTAPLAEEQLPTQEELEAQKYAIEHSQEINQTGEGIITIMQRAEQQTTQKLEATREGFAKKAYQLNAPRAMQIDLAQPIVNPGPGTYHEAKQAQQASILEQLFKNPYQMTENKKADMRRGTHGETTWVQKQQHHELNPNGGA